MDTTEAVPGTVTPDRAGMPSVPGTDGTPSAVDGTAAAQPPPGSVPSPVHASAAVPIAPTEALSEATRRTFLTYTAGAASSFIGLVLGLPILGYLAAPLAARVKASWMSLGKADTFKPGEPKLVALSVTRQDGWREVTEARTAWVVAQGSNKFLAFNGRCTHLGCAYSWRTEGEHAKRFFCPCHDGAYDANGTVVAGPPPRSLDRLEVKVDGSDLMVLYQDFRLGVPVQEPA